MILTHNGTRLTVNGSGLDPVLPATGATFLAGWAGNDDHPEVRRDISGTWMNLQGADAAEGWDRMDFGAWVYDPVDGATRWLAAGHNDRPFLFNVGLIPRDVTPGKDNATGRKARWDAMFDDLLAGNRDTELFNHATHWAIQGPKNAAVYAAVLWEMNQYAADMDAARFRAAYEHAVPIFRAGFASVAEPGQALHLGQSAMGSLQASAWQYLPTDLTTIDFVAHTLYAGVYQTTQATEAQVRNYVTTTLNNLAAKGREIGKPVGLTELGNWATKVGVTGQQTRGLGDWPELIHIVADWAEDPANNVAFVVHFDINHGADNNDLKLTDTPLTLAAMAERFPA